MASGIKISEEIQLTYNKLKLKVKGEKQLKYIVLRFNEPDLTTLEIEVTKDRTEAAEDGLASDGERYDALMNSLPQDQARYVFYDLEFVNKDDLKVNNPLAVMWCPGTASIKRKMLAASTLSALKTSLKLGKNLLEGDEITDVDSKEALSKVGGKSY